MDINLKTAWQNKPSRERLIRFALFVLLALASLISHLPRLPDLWLRLRAAPDWFLQIDTATPLTANTTTLLLLLALWGCFAAIGLIRQAMQRQGDLLSFVLQSLTVAICVLSLSLLQSVRQSRTVAWQHYTQAVETLMATAQTQAPDTLEWYPRLQALHPQIPPATEKFSRRLGLSATAYETREIQLQLNATGQVLSGYMLQQIRFEDQQECLLLQFFPADQPPDLPLPCEQKTTGEPLDEQNQTDTQTSP